LVLDGAQGELKPGDVFLLCSDGLTRHVEDAEIRAALEEMSPQAAADHLLDLTLARGGADNVTAVVLSVRPAEAAAVAEAPGPDRMDALLREVP
jgi:protein phosphatase